MKSTLVLFVCAFLLLTCLSSLAPAQSTFGSITGTVTDQTGARVSNARITVTNQDTGVMRKVTAGSDGVYSVPNLLPGTYRVSVEAGGFNLLERSGVVLDANRIVNVDAQLAVGSSTTKVEVSAAPP